MQVRCQAGSYGRGTTRSASNAQGTGTVAQQGREATCARETAHYRAFYQIPATGWSMLRLAGVERHIRDPLQLLTKFMADKDKVRDLLEIGVHLDMKHVRGNNEKQLEALLRILDTIVERNADLTVLDAAAKVYAHFRTNEAPLRARIETSYNTLIDGLVLGFKQSAQLLQNADGE